MVYDRIEPAVFIKRLNRFTAEVELRGRRELCHVKNTGRCAELLTGGARVWVQRRADGDGLRKTACTLITADRNGILVNVDSAAPNRLFFEWAEKGRLPFLYTAIQPERTYRRSRFDFFLPGEGKGAFCEVKGVTLLRGETAFFPDAPTTRGLKHVQEMRQAVKEGYGGMILFFIQLKGAKAFRPNDETQPEFGKALRQALCEGVCISAVDCRVTADSVIPEAFVPVLL